MRLLQSKPAAAQLDQRLLNANANNYGTAAAHTFVEIRVPTPVAQTPATAGWKNTLSHIFSRSRTQSTAFNHLPPDVIRIIADYICDVNPQDYRGRYFLQGRENREFIAWFHELQSQLQSISNNEVSHHQLTRLTPPPQMPADLLAFLFSSNQIFSKVMLSSIDSNESRCIMNEMLLSARLHNIPRIQGDYPVNSLEQGPYFVSSSAWRRKCVLQRIDRSQDFEPATPSQILQNSLLMRQNQFDLNDPKALPAHYGLMRLMQTFSIKNSRGNCFAMLSLMPLALMAWLVFAATQKHPNSSLLFTDCLDNTTAALENIYGIGSDDGGNSQAYRLIKSSCNATLPCTTVFNNATVANISLFLSDTTIAAMTSLCMNACTWLTQGIYTSQRPNMQDIYRTCLLDSDHDYASNVIIGLILSASVTIALLLANYLASRLGYYGKNNEILIDRKKLPAAAQCGLFYRPAVVAPLGEGLAAGFALSE